MNRFGPIRVSDYCFELIIEHSLLRCRRTIGCNCPRAVCFVASFVTFEKDGLLNVTQVLTIFLAGLIDGHHWFEDLIGGLRE